VILRRTTRAVTMTIGGLDRRRRLDLEQLDVEHEHALRLAGRALVRELVGIQNRTLSPTDITRDPVGPADDHAAERELRRLALITDESNIRPSVVQPV